MTGGGMIIELCKNLNVPKSIIMHMIRQNNIQNTIHTVRKQIFI